jgi:hypothetical protein
MKINSLLYVGLVAVLAVNVIGCFKKTAKNPAFVPGTALALPVDKGVKVSWAVPSLGEGVDPSQWASCQFVVDGRGDCWLKKGANVLMNVSKGFSFQLDKDIDDFVWLDSGDLQIVSGNLLETVESAAKHDHSPQGLLLVHFKPELKFPVNSPRLTQAGPHGIYIWGSNPKTSKNEIYFFSASGKAIQVLFASTEKIGAVGGDGVRTFAAVDHLILELSKKKITGLAREPEDIRGLRYAEGIGLFYSTASGIRYLNPDNRKCIDFFRSPHTQMDLKRGALYLCLGEASGVVKITGLEVFNQFKPVPPVVAAAVTLTK